MRKRNASKAMRTTAGGGAGVAVALCVWLWHCVCGCGIVCVAVALCVCRGGCGIVCVAVALCVWLWQCVCGCASVCVAVAVPVAWFTHLFLLPQGLLLLVGLLHRALDHHLDDTRWVNEHAWVRRIRVKRTVFGVPMRVCVYACMRISVYVYERICVSGYMCMSV